MFRQVTFFLPWPIRVEPEKHVSGKAAIFSDVRPSLQIKDGPIQELYGVTGSAGQKPFSIWPDVLK
jgi:hypothetical protein